MALHLVWDGVSYVETFIEEFLEHLGAPLAQCAGEISKAATFASKNFQHIIRVQNCAQGEPSLDSLGMGYAFVSDVKYSKRSIQEHTDGGRRRCLAIPQLPRVRLEVFQILAGVIAMTSHGGFGAEGSKSG